LADSLVYIKNYKRQGVHNSTVTHHKPSAHEVGSTESIILFTVLAETKENGVYRHLKPDESYYKQRLQLCCHGDRLQPEQLLAMLLGFFSPPFAESLKDTTSPSTHGELLPSSNAKVWKCEHMPVCSSF
jgi:hypothetical protein